MKMIKKLLPIALISLITMNANAAFVVKQNVPQATELSQQTLTSNEASSFENVKLEPMQTKTTLKSKIAKKFLASSSGVSKTAYILLSIIGLGWLAMGLNDDWKGDDWVIALGVSIAGFLIAALLSLFIPILPFIFIFTGAVWCLMKMKKYYK